MRTSRCGAFAGRALFPEIDEHPDDSDEGRPPRRPRRVIAPALVLELGDRGLDEALHVARVEQELRRAEEADARKAGHVGTAFSPRAICACAACTVLPSAVS